MRRWRCCNRKAELTAILTNAFINSSELLQTVTGTPAFPTATITTRAETVRSLADSLAGCVNTNGSTPGEHAMCAALRRRRRSAGSIRTGGYDPSRGEHHPQSEAECWNGLSTRCSCGCLLTRAEHGAERLDHWIFIAASHDLSVRRPMPGSECRSQLGGHRGLRTGNDFNAGWLRGGGVFCNSHLLD